MLEDIGRRHSVDRILATGEARRQHCFSAADRDLLSADRALQSKIDPETLHTEEDGPP
jgi:hypothetical protein